MTHIYIYIYLATQAVLWALSAYKPLEPRDLGVL